MIGVNTVGSRCESVEVASRAPSASMEGADDLPPDDEGRTRPVRLRCPLGAQS